MAIIDGRPYLAVVAAEKLARGSYGVAGRITLGGTSSRNDQVPAAEWVVD